MAGMIDFFMGHHEDSLQMRDWRDLAIENRSGQVWGADAGEAVGRMTLRMVRPLGGGVRTPIPTTNEAGVAAWSDETGNRRRSGIVVASAPLASFWAIRERSARSYI